MKFIHTRLAFCVSSGRLLEEEMRVTQTATTEETGLRPRGADADKRRAIIEAAQDLFTTVGYENTTMAHVAGKAGVAVGTVYLYFKNKNDLLIAVKDGWEEEVLRALTLPELATLPHHLRARPMIKASFDICARHTEMVQLMGMQAEMVGDWKTTVPAPIQEALKAFLEEAMSVGAIREIDTEKAAVVLYGMVNSALLQCFTKEGGKDQDGYIDLLVDAVLRWLVNPNLLTGQIS
jgi:AcrR family transcriptional regulator